MYVSPKASVSAQCLLADACPLFTGFWVSGEADTPETVQLPNTEVLDIYWFFEMGFLCVTSLELTL